jgi:hypothetical protein
MAVPRPRRMPGLSRTPWRPIGVSNLAAWCAIRITMRRRLNVLVASVPANVVR